MPSPPAGQAGDEKNYIAFSSSLFNLTFSYQQFNDSSQWKLSVKWQVKLSSKESAHLCLKTFLYFVTCLGFAGPVIVSPTATGFWLLVKPQPYEHRNDHTTSNPILQYMLGFPTHTAVGRNKKVGFSSTKQPRGKGNPKAILSDQKHGHGRKIKSWF